MALKYSICVVNGISDVLNGGHHYSTSKSDAWALIMVLCIVPLSPPQPTVIEVHMLSCLPPPAVLQAEPSRAFRTGRHRFRATSNNTSPKPCQHLRRSRSCVRFCDFRLWQPVTSQQACDRDDRSLLNARNRFDTSNVHWPGQHVARPSMHADVASESHQARKSASRWRLADCLERARMYVGIRFLGTGHEPLPATTSSIWRPSNAPRVLPIREPGAPKMNMGREHVMRMDPTWSRPCGRPASVVLSRCQIPTSMRALRCTAIPAKFGRQQRSRFVVAASDMTCPGVNCKACCPITVPIR